MAHRVTLAAAAAVITALRFLQASAESIAAPAVGIGDTPVGATTASAAAVRAATASMATTGAAPIGAATVSAATVGTATAGAATVGGAKVGAATAAMVVPATVGVATAAPVVPATVGPIELTIPDGFEFARSGHHDGARVSAWTKAQGPTKALLQVTLYDMGSTADTSTPQELSQAAQAYLRQFLGGVERRRTHYELSPVRELNLASGPAATATWTGKLAGVDTVGVMYCAIVRKRYVVIFHTQDVGDAPTAAMRDAMKAIEAARALPH